MPKKPDVDQVLNDAVIQVIELVWKRYRKTAGNANSNPIVRKLVSECMILTSNLENDLRDPQVDHLRVVRNIGFLTGVLSAVRVIESNGEESILPK